MYLVKKKKTIFNAQKHFRRLQHQRSLWLINSPVNGTRLPPQCFTLSHSHDREERGGGGCSLLLVGSTKLKGLPLRNSRLKAAARQAYSSVNVVDCRGQWLCVQIAKPGMVIMNGSQNLVQPINCGPVQGRIGSRGGYHPPPPPLQSAQPMASHCLFEGKCQPQWHL